MQRTVKVAVSVEPHLLYQILLAKLLESTTALRHVFVSRLAEVPQVLLGEKKLGDRLIAADVAKAPLLVRWKGGLLRLRRTENAAVADDCCPRAATAVRTSSGFWTILISILISLISIAVHGAVQADNLTNRTKTRQEKPNTT